MACVSGSLVLLRSSRMACFAQHHCFSLKHEITTILYSAACTAGDDDGLCWISAVSDFQTHDLAAAQDSTGLPLRLFVTEYAATQDSYTTSHYAHHWTFPSELRLSLSQASNTAHATINIFTSRQTPIHICTMSPLPVCNANPRKLHSCDAR